MDENDSNQNSAQKSGQVSAEIRAKLGPGDAQHKES